MRPHAFLLLALVVVVGVAPKPSAAGDWHGDVLYAATVWSDTTFQFIDVDVPMTREGTLRDGGVIADVGWWVTPRLSLLLQAAADVERATWTSDAAERDPLLLRADLLGGVRLAPWRSADDALVPFADVLFGVEATGAPAGTPQEEFRPAPAAALSLGLLAGRGRIQALAAVRLRENRYSVSYIEAVDCSPRAPSCVSWVYAPSGGTVQALLGVAFR